MVGQLPSCSLQDLSHLDSGHQALNQGGTSSEGGSSNDTGGTPNGEGGANTGGSGGTVKTGGMPGTTEGGSTGAAGEPPETGGAAGELGDAGSGGGGGEAGAAEGGAPPEGGSAGAAGADVDPGEGGASGAGGSETGGTGGGTSSPTLGEDIALNGDVEVGTAYGWLPHGSCTLVVSANDPYEGTYAIACTNRANHWDGPSQNLAGLVQPGAQYQFSVWVRTTDATKRRVQASRKAQCADETEPRYLTQIAFAQVGDEWVHLQGKFSTEVDCDLVEYTVYFENATGVSEFPDIYVDALSIREIID
ncbi:MAG: carbohydrate binding domain-containing protein [Pseudomonadota bacterium]|nr:MAG: hypothetical protein DIU78_05565 [Pseudomonadota bacterium]